MPRPQFTLRALLVAMLVVGAFLAGMALQRKLDEPRVMEIRECGATAEAIVTPDGRTWLLYDDASDSR